MIVQIIYHYRTHFSLSICFKWLKVLKLVPMGLKYTLLVTIGVCLLLVRLIKSKDRYDHYRVGIHCKGRGYPEDAITTRSCCKKAHVSCREHISEHRKKPNCIVYNNSREDADVKDCCLQKMDWAIGRTAGDRC